jgi:hypothetical protein
LAAAARDGDVGRFRRRGLAGDVSSCVGTENTGRGSGRGAGRRSRTCPRAKKTKGTLDIPLRFGMGAVLMVMWTAVVRV